MKGRGVYRPYMAQRTRSDREALEKPNRKTLTSETRHSNQVSAGVLTRMKSYSIHLGH